jgi:hypothetical protein
MPSPSRDVTAPETLHVSVSGVNTKTRHFSPEIIAEADEFLLDEVFSDADYLVSIGLSLREAARRSDRAEIRLRLGQLRDTLVHAIRTNNLLSPADPQIAGSKA